jgi:ABC-2 type transport system ATP-binding protein
MIEAQGLTKYYGTVPAIEGVSFRVEQGEILGFLGPNGAGKTTTMRILTGFMPSSAGTAVVAGYDIGNDPLEVKRRVGYMPENVPLYTEMVVWRFLQYVAEIKGVPRDARKAEVDEAIERCGLEAVANRVIRNLSKGYRQRVGLAQALVGKPPVLILDEPTVGLDPAQIVEIRELIRRLASEHTVLLSTHILPEVAMLCQRVLIIHRGRVVAEDTMANLAGAAGVDLDIEGPAANIEQVLRQVPEVAEARHQSGRHYFVRSHGQADPSAAVARAVVDAGFGLLSLRRRTRSLEDVFMEAIATEPGDVQ